MKQGLYKHIVAWMTVAGLASCAGPSPDGFYRPAEEPGAYGYDAVQLDDDRYRVSFTGETGTDEQAVKDLALLRAAELTLQEGHEWFRIVTEETEATSRTTNTREEPRDNTEVVRECGPLGCTTTLAPSYSGDDVVVLDEAGKYATTFEIVMGSGETVDPTTIYNAAELRDFIEARYDV